MSKLVKVFVCLAAIIMPVSVANACDCAPPKTVESHIANTEVIFRGKVRWTIVKSYANDVPSATYTNNATTTFETIEVWKGPAITSVPVNHGLYIGSCGVIFEKDITYLIFASLDDEGNIYTTYCHTPYFTKDTRGYERTLKKFPSKKNSDLTLVSVKLPFVQKVKLYLVDKFKRNNQ